MLEMLTSANLPLYKEEALKLHLFDESYYTSNYPDYIHYGLSPIDHYFQYGWKLGYNPSAHTNNDRYIQISKCEICPIIHFFLQGKNRALYFFSSNPYPLSKQCIDEYLEQKQRRRATKVLYTCLIQDYDELMPIHHMEPDWDYVCFTDDEALLRNEFYNGWEMHKADNPKNLDPTRLNRWYKVHPHLLFPEYEESIYIDSNINILTRFLYDLASSRNQKILLPKHFSAPNIYEHFHWAMASGIDDKKILQQQKQFYVKEGFPESIGLGENNILYRKHNLPEMIQLMEDWWNMIVQYSKRDQLSLAYVMWKNNIIIDDYFFYGSRSDLTNFLFVAHKAKENT